MGRIHIVTDSTCDLTKEEITKHGIHVVPLTISIGQNTYVDGIDIEPITFMDIMKRSSELPKVHSLHLGNLKSYTTSLEKMATKFYQFI